MSIDKEGFQHLEWSADELKIVRHPKKKKIKVKASGKEQKLLKEFKKSRVPKDIKGFHSTKLKNYSITEATKSEFRNNSSKLKLPKQSVVLINIGEDLFYRLPIKAYAKLCKLQSVTVETCITVQDDYMESAQNLYRQTKVMFSINELLKFAVNSRYLVDVVYGIQDKASIFSDYDFKFKLLAIYDSGKIDYYKSINDFLKDFDLREI